jgi:predicted CoA-binding protein
MSAPAAPPGAHVAVLGASPKAHRYSHQAVKLLREYGYQITPVHPRAATVAGVEVTPDLASVPRPVHTLTLYVSPAHLAPLTGELIHLAPARVIFNPGSESPEMQRRLDQAGIPWIEACTLVMLRARTF